MAWIQSTNAPSTCIRFECIGERRYRLLFATDANKWEIYLFIVTLRMKSTYPVMFVMIFDSISLEGILKWHIKWLHSCLMNDVIGSCSNGGDTIKSAALCHNLCFFSYSLNAKLQCSNGFRLLATSMLYFPSFISVFFFMSFIGGSSGERSLFANQIPYKFIEFPYDLRVACMHNVILLFCSRLFKITSGRSIGNERHTLCLYVVRSWIHVWHRMYVFSCENKKKSEQDEMRTNGKFL